MPTRPSPPVGSRCGAAGWFTILTRKQIRRGTYASVPQLIAAIKRFIETHNDHAKPFVWTKTADQILAKAVRQEASGSGH